MRCKETKNSIISNMELSATMIFHAKQITTMVDELTLINYRKMMISLNHNLHTP